jgi:hypothetical protein
MHGTFYILRSPEVHRKLKRELLLAWPELKKEPDLSELEKLPYLVLLCSNLAVPPAEPDLYFLDRSHQRIPSRKPWSGISTSKGSACFGSYNRTKIHPRRGESHEKVSDGLESRSADAPAVDRGRNEQPFRPPQSSCVRQPERFQS